uniref:Uncharacterized protein n=1 Tax=Ascaris lumbricoides TaxID=6252 RepID=A0A0M3IXA3_ASCLU
MRAVQEFYNRNANVEDKNRLRRLSFILVKSKFYNDHSKSLSMVASIKDSSINLNASENVFWSFKKVH